jgi:ATP-dependent Zn protease
MRINIVSLLGLVVAMVTVAVVGKRSPLSNDETSSSVVAMPVAEWVDFSSIGGYENVKEELMQVVDYLRFTEKYHGWNVRLPKGCLLYGPPGTGKTLFAKSLVGEVNKLMRNQTNRLPISFFISSGSEFVEKYVGVGASRIRELFEAARSHAPSILYIDEIDGIGRRRSDGHHHASGGDNERDTTLNQLLVEMDGFLSGGREASTDPRNMVLVLASTNRMEALDPALLRPGRFDKKIRIPLPDESTRALIIDIHAANKPFSTMMDWGLVASRVTRGMTGADIENLFNEATLRALRRNELPITYHELYHLKRELFDFGSSAGSSNLNLTKSMLHRIAVHEVGHVLTAWIMMEGEETKMPEYVTIENPSPGVLGYAAFPPMSVLLTARDLFGRMCVLFGGRIAEEVVFGMENSSTGASGDFTAIRTLAHQMIHDYGMDPSNYSLPLPLPSLSLSSSSSTGGSIGFDHEQSIITTARDHVRDLLAPQKTFLECSANVLVHKKYLSQKSLRRMQKRWQDQSSC